MVRLCMAPMNKLVFLDYVPQLDYSLNQGTCHTLQTPSFLEIQALLKDRFQNIHPERLCFAYF